MGEILMSLITVFQYTNLNVEEKIGKGRGEQISRKGIMIQVGVTGKIENHIDAIYYIW